MKVASPAPEVQTAVALIAQRDQGPSQGPQWQAAVFAALPQAEQVRYLCHVLSQSTLNADEALQASRLTGLYRKQHGESPRAAIERLPADVRRDMIARNPKGDSKALNYNFWTLDL